MVNTAIPLEDVFRHTDYMIGDAYDDTAILPLSEVAVLLEEDLINVQGDELITEEAVFQVTAEKSGFQDVLRVVVSGLTEPVDPDGFDAKIINDTIRSVFELATYYNYVDRRQLNRCRFILAVNVVSDNAALIRECIGMMHFYS